MTCQELTHQIFISEMRSSQILVTSSFSLVFCSMVFSSEWTCTYSFPRLAWEATALAFWGLGDLLLRQLEFLFCVGLQHTVSLALLRPPRCTSSGIFHCAVAFHHLLPLPKPIEEVRERFFHGVQTCSELVFFSQNLLDSGFSEFPLFLSLLHHPGRRSPQTRP